MKDALVLSPESIKALNRYFGAKRNEVYVKAAKAKRLQKRRAANKRAKVARRRSRRVRGATTRQHK
jgi:hypothetical protein